MNNTIVSGNRYLSGEFSSTAMTGSLFTEKNPIAGEIKLEPPKAYKEFQKDMSRNVEKSIGPYRKKERE